MTTIIPLPVVSSRRAAGAATTRPAVIAAFPLNRSPAVAALADEMAQHRTQAPARAAWRERTKPLAKRLRSLGIEQEAIELELAALAREVGARLDARKRRRIAGAAEQLEARLVARIGERRAAAAPPPAMPRPAPPEPRFRIRWPSKVSLHATFHDQHAVDRHVDGLMRMTAEGAQQHIVRNLASLGRLLLRLGVDDEAAASFTCDYASRVHATYWRRVFDPPSPKGTTPP